MARFGPVAARRLLVVAAALFAPLPYWAVEVERAPLVRLAVLAIATAAAAIAEPGGTITIVASALAAQAVLWTLGLAVLARLAVRWMPESWRAMVVALVVGLLAAASFLPLYRMPFARSGPRANVFGVLQ